MNLNQVNKCLVDIYMRANETEESPLRAIIDDECVRPVFELIRVKFEPNLIYSKFDYSKQIVTIITYLDNEIIRITVPGYFFTNLDFIQLVIEETVHLSSKDETSNGNINQGDD